MRRLGLIIASLVISAPPALAQSTWVPWGAPVGGYSQPSQGQQYQQYQQYKAQKSKQLSRRQRASDDDDDDFGSVFGTQPGGQIPYQKSTFQYPAVLEGGPRPEIDARAPPQVPFHAGYAPGSIVIDTGSRALYYVLNNGSAYRYPISVGRDGFRWKGTEKISRVAAWPDWHPPAEMRERDPKLPEVMTGGIRNPLGAKALYLGNSLYRIHGTNDAKSIGYAASSGCFRMMNYHVMHLGSLAGVGTPVHVLDHLPNAVATATPVSAKPRAKPQG